MSRSRHTSPAMSNDGASHGAGVAVFGGFPDTDVDRVRAKRTRDAREQPGTPARSTNSTTKNTGAQDHMPSTRSHETANTSMPSHLLRRHRWSIDNPSTRTTTATAPSPAPQITFPTKLRISRSSPGSTLSGTSANRTNTRDIVLPRRPQLRRGAVSVAGQALGQTRAKAHGGSGVESGGAGGGMSSSSSGLVLDEVRMYNPAGEDHRT
ncbi:hypothetical protein EDB86DRAFT_3082907 [Lactarius hatsudake]|nr:hypothetical protein EDB86DRAFT_3082907 [Lactarius hatsudake]